MKQRSFKPSTGVFYRGVTWLQKGRVKHPVRVYPMKLLGDDRICRRGFYCLCTTGKAIKSMEELVHIISNMTVHFGLQRCRVMHYLTSRLLLYQEMF